MVEIVKAIPYDENIASYLLDSEVVSLSEVKQHLGIFDSNFDQLLSTYISSAITQLEELTNLNLRKTGGVNKYFRVPEDVNADTVFFLDDIPYSTLISTNGLSDHVNVYGWENDTYPFLTLLTRMRLYAPTVLSFTSPKLKAVSHVHEGESGVQPLEDDSLDGIELIQVQLDHESPNVKIDNRAKNPMVKTVLFTMIAEMHRHKELTVPNNAINAVIKDQLKHLMVYK